MVDFTKANKGYHTELVLISVFIDQKKSPLESLEAVDVGPQ